MDGFKRQPTTTPPPLARGDVNDLPAPTDAPRRPEPLEMTNPEISPAQPDPRPVDKAQKPHSRKMLWLLIAIGIVLLMSAICYAWYSLQLRPVDSDSKDKKQFVVKDGESFGGIAIRLKDQKLIRNTTAFDIAARLSAQRAGIKAGTCSLNPSLTSNEILRKLTTGCHDFKEVTFYPGATIEKPFYKSPSATLSQTLYVKNVLKKAGYSDQAIERGLQSSYKNPLFAGKPASATLEGYIYGETYYVATDASVESVLESTFTQMYKVVTEFDLPAAYKKQGLDTLYDGVTMASIVQRELNCEDKPSAERKDRCYEYQRKIAQVLLKRLKEGIPLGADVTFIYAADMAKQQPTIDFDSPYNTRTHAGLPPGPIGAPGKLALKAVADPSETDYLYFVAGDDGLIYFSKTQAEHDKNTRDHCQKLCYELN